MSGFVATFAIVLTFGAIPFLIASAFHKTSRDDLEFEKEFLGADTSESDDKWLANEDAPWNRDGVAPDLRE